VFNKINSFGVIVGVKEELNIINKYNVLVKIGYGKVNARKVARELAKKVDCIVSFGFAGSLDPNLNNGHVIIPKNLVTYNNKQKLKLSQKYRLIIKKRLNMTYLNENDLTSVDEIINDKKIKTQLFNKFNVSSIDMESEAINNVSREFEIPFIILRVIFDDTKFSIPEFIKKNTDHKGNVKYTKVLVNLIKEPFQIFQFFKLIKYYCVAKNKLRDTAKKAFG
tara:strand:- start:443 stop:1108 length:666 start_codon:yes stop_codon:yes gene_type:complete